MLKIHNSRIFLFVLITLYSLHTFASDHDDDDASIFTFQAFTVHIDWDTQEIAGLQTQILKQTHLNQETQTFATRIDLSPLINTRKDYIDALAQMQMAQMAVKQSTKNVQRLQSLQREKAVSARKLLQQKTQLEMDKITYEATLKSIDTLQLLSRSQWGPVLSLWFLSDGKNADKILNAINNALYLINIPETIPPPARVFMAPPQQRKHAQTASLISAAPAYTVSQQTGKPYYYLTDQPSQSNPQRVNVWLAQKNQQVTGFMIPSPALVWHLGQPYVYLKVEKELFKRIRITSKKLIDSHTYFIQQTLQEGDMLVISGAQMLLSEEFRAQIPDEDDDDDDDDKKD